MTRLLCFFLSHIYIMDQEPMTQGGGAVCFYECEDTPVHEMRKDKKMKTILGYIAGGIMCLIALPFILLNYFVADDL